MNQPTMNHSRRAVAIVELLAVLVAVVVLLAVAVPALSRTSCDRREARSTDNLRTLAVAHTMYAIDWNDRQFTLIRDDVGVYGGDCGTYQAEVGCHPPVILGENCDGNPIGFYLRCDGSGGGCFNFVVNKPFNFFGGSTYFGSFRVPNASGFHEYVNGRFFDPVFYAPKDGVILDRVEQYFGVDCPFPDDVANEDIFTASYVTSPAAMFDPAVFPSDLDGGWRNPDSLDDGYRSPTVSQALYPDRKTRMIEHHWLQDFPAEPCNPGFGGCEPYYFNHSLRSRPYALFYDGSVSHLSVLEAIISDERIDNQTGSGLWSRTTPLGQNGYLIAYGYDFAKTSYHVLTIDGIRGRDTVVE